VPVCCRQELEGTEGERVELAPGQATLHHIRLAHRSAPAAPDSQPRLGLAIRYMAAHVQQGLQPKDSGGRRRHPGRSAARLGEATVIAARLTGPQLCHRRQRVDISFAHKPHCAVTVVAGMDTFRHYRHEQGPPAAAMDAAALEQHRAAVAAVYPEGFERGQ
jgi:hypothetical protein